MADKLTQAITDTQVREEIRQENLAEVLLSFTTTQKEYDITLKMINNPETTTKDYVLALSSGLQYGNWPWTTHSTPKDFKGDE